LAGVADDSNVPFGMQDVTQKYLRCTATKMFFNQNTYWTARKKFDLFV
jgi:hypothetical protein